jgi:hypothetical protein
MKLATPKRAPKKTDRENGGLPTVGCPASARGSQVRIPDRGPNKEDRKIPSVNQGCRSPCLLGGPPGTARGRKIGGRRVAACACRRESSTNGHP